MGRRKRSTSINSRVRDPDSTGCPGGATMDNADASCGPMLLSCPEPWPLR